MMTRKAAPLRWRAICTSCMSSSTARSTLRALDGCMAISSYLSGPHRSSQIDGRQEFVPCFRLIAKHAQHAARHHRGVALGYAPAGHAAVGAFDNDRDTQGLEDPLQGIGNLCRDPLLNLKPLGIDLDEPRQLGNPDHPVVRDIADMRPPDDRRHMVFAMGFKTDPAQQYHFIISGDLLESSLQQFLRLLAVTGKPFLIGAGDTGRRFDESLAIRIVAGPPNEGAHGLFRLCAGGPPCPLRQFGRWRVNGSSVMYRLKRVHTDFLQTLNP